MTVRPYPGARAIGLLALALLAPDPAAVQAQPSGEGADDARLVEQILAEEQDVEWRTVGLARLRLSYPQQASGAVGVMRARKPTDFNCTTVCDYRGYLVQLEPGIGGIQLGIGYAVLVGEKKANRFFLSDYLVGYGVKLVGLRTWSDGPLDPPEQSFIGIEGDFTIASTNFSLGVVRGIGTGPEDEDWLVVGGLGWGF